MPSLKSLLLHALRATTVVTAVVNSRDDSSSYLSGRGEEPADSTASSKEKNKITNSAKFQKDTNPEGFINLGVAENFLMHEDIKSHVESNFSVSLDQDLTYGPSIGSPRLQNALASFFNDEFHPVDPVIPEEIAIGAGITGLIDQIAYSICDDGEGILIPKPLYNSFQRDFELRSNAPLVPASFLVEGQNYDMDIAFDATANYKALELAYETAKRRGVTIKGVVIVNPHNPLSRCYTPEALKEFARFCGEKKIHLFSDEIYAKSVYTNDQYPDATPFNSILSLKLNDLIDPNLVHVLYGMSKDFAASGFRLGVIQSRNEPLINAIVGLNSFSRPPFISQAMWAGILEDKEYLQDYWKRYSERLTASFNTMRDWLDQRGATYFKGTNAGLFLWARLINWPEELSAEGYSTWRAKFLELCLDAKLNVADGDSYKPDNVEKGWFRLTHSVGVERQKAGLERLATVLSQMQSAKAR